MVPGARGRPAAGLFALTFLLIVGMVGAAWPHLGAHFRLSGSWHAPLDRPADQAVSLLPANPLATFRSVVGNGKNRIEVVSLAADSAPPGATGSTEVLRVVVRDTNGQGWQTQVRWLNTRPIVAGDTILVRFWARALESTFDTGEGNLQIVIQQGRPPWQISSEFTLAVQRSWQHFEVPMRLEMAYDADGAQLALNLGFHPQVVELGAVEWLNYGRAINPASLPQTAVTYGGRESAAAWRLAAAERIERLRKANVTIRVVDATGHPIAGARVKARMTRHAFGFGTAVTARGINDPGSDNERYRAILARYFNKAVFEGDMKWVAMEQPPDPAGRHAQRQATLDAVDWLLAHGFTVRGHTMIWPGWGGQWPFLPPDLRPLVEQQDTEGLNRRLRARIVDVATLFRNRVAEWDVVNEPTSEHVLQDVLGPDAVAQWFRWAREADPGAALYLNDYCLLSGGAIVPKRLEQCEATVRDLLQRGAPIDGFGEQAHFSSRLIDIERMLALLDHFAALGLPIQITEFDVATTDEHLQADFTRDFLTAAFSHPAINGIVLWGFWEKRHWQPSAALWRADWSLKPNGEVFIDLVTRQWWTNVDGTTGADGSVGLRGFCGSYSVEATAADGRLSTANLDLPCPGGTALTLQLP